MTNQDGNPYAAPKPTEIATSEPTEDSQLQRRVSLPLTILAFLSRVQLAFSLLAVFYFLFVDQIDTRSGRFDWDRAVVPVSASLAYLVYAVIAYWIVARTRKRLTRRWVWISSIAALFVAWGIVITVWLLVLLKITKPSQSDERNL